MFCKNLELDQFPLQAFQASYKIEFKLSSGKAGWERAETDQMFNLVQ